MAPLLKVEDLTVTFEVSGRQSPVIQDLSFEIGEGEVLGVVGESGCGKSITALAILGLVPAPPGRITGGRILFDGEDLVAAGEKRLQQIRGNSISMVFQEPMTSLNPVFTVGEQIAETVRSHYGVGKREARDRAIEMLRRVGIPSPERRVDNYPHQMSGGMRQRVMIAIALVCEPKLLIADEPTTALDVTVQAQIFDLFQDLREQMGTAIMLITHDIGVISQIAHYTMVMYAGRRIEGGRTADVIRNPLHPYTSGLISCIPHLRRTGDMAFEPLYEIKGIVPPVSALARPGCHFAARCSKAMEQCLTLAPADTEGKDGHDVACWLFEQVDA